MKNVLSILALSLLLFLFPHENKSRQESSLALQEAHSKESYQQPDTIVTEEEKELQEEVKKPSNPTSSSSSRSQKSSNYDNMRGFDPASEDDMDDNGMSRYMENDDEEGWD